MVKILERGVFPSSVPGIEYLDDILLKKDSYRLKRDERLKVFEKNLLWGSDDFFFFF
jgi:hypothetical protein